MQTDKTDKKSALVFGAGGQAGWHMCQFLLKKGYTVFGTWKHNAAVTTNMPPEVREHFGPVHCDIRKQVDIDLAYWVSNPTEVYNFAGCMFAPKSWENPGEYAAVNGVAVQNMLHYASRMQNPPKFFNAGSAEMFARTGLSYDEETPIEPQNPYGLSKQFAYEAVRIYRAQEKLFACTGIFCNMESARRERFFFAEKVCGALVNGEVPLRLGKLNALRDWGLTREYVEAAWLMLQAKKPQDYVIGTGVVASCRDFVWQALAATGWSSEEVIWQPATYDNSDLIYSDPSKIRAELGWTAKTYYPQVVWELVDEFKEQKKEASAAANQNPVAG